MDQDIFWFLFAVAGCVCMFLWWAWLIYNCCYECKYVSWGRQYIDRDFLSPSNVHIVHLTEGTQRIQREITLAPYTRGYWKSTDSCYWTVCIGRTSAKPLGTTTRGCGHKTWRTTTSTCTGLSIVEMHGAMSPITIVYDVIQKTRIHILNLTILNNIFAIANLPDHPHPANLCSDLTTRFF